MSHTDCVIEGQNRRVANGSRWTDSDDDCITCTCNVSLRMQRASAREHNTSYISELHIYKSQSHYSVKHMFYVIWNKIVPVCSSLLKWITTIS